MSLTSSDRAALASWDAVETAARVRNKDVTAAEVVEAAIARAEEARHLGGIVTETYDRARTRARVPNIAGTLAGVPTFIKDLTQVHGVATGWGSRGAGEYVSRRSDVVVRHLEGSGAVTLGKSATPEFGLTATTEPLGKPPCRNPWDPTRSAGGSSGGAACLVAAGVVPMAHASDGGGSIRIPAACCGLVGLKPSRFRIDMEGSNLLPVNIATYGVLTRTVRDTIAFYEALESRVKPRRVEVIGRVASRPLRTLRVAVFVEAPNRTPVDPEIQAVALEAGKLCESLGHRVDEIAVPFESIVVEDFLQYWGFVAWIQKHTARLMLHWDFDVSKYEPWTLGIAGTFVDRRYETLQAIRRLRKFVRTYESLMERYDVLVSPTMAQLTAPLGHLATDAPFELVYDRIRQYVPFTPIQNAAGAPAISLPLGRSRSGLPIGVQLGAARGKDRLLLELASSIELAVPWERVAPRSKWLPKTPSNGASAKSPNPPPTT